MENARILTVLSLVALMLGLLISPLHAGHGSWTHHEAHLTIHPATKAATGYADVGATSKLDLVAARLIITNSNGSVHRDVRNICTDGNEKCPNYLKTVTISFNAAGKEATSVACAKDDSHNLGTWIEVFCSPWGMGGHFHYYGPW